MFKYFSIIVDHEIGSEVNDFCEASGAQTYVDAYFEMFASILVSQNDGAVIANRIDEKILRPIVRIFRSQSQRLELKNVPQMIRSQRINQAKTLAYLFLNLKALAIHFKELRTCWHVVSKLIARIIAQTSELKLEP